MFSYRIRRSYDLDEGSMTPEGVFRNRREVLKLLGLGGMSIAGGAGMAIGSAGCMAFQDDVEVRKLKKLQTKRNDAYAYSKGRGETPEDKATRYNNFYEFTESKGDVWRVAAQSGFDPDPWKVTVSGLCKKPFEIGLEDLYKLFPLEDRQYNFRCVERWAMQVPWVGFPLRKLIEKAEPKTEAKFIRFESLLDHDRYPRQKKATWYPWPYYEGLRMDEAMNDLALVVVGVYGKELPPQNGSPIRIVTPWKYGYKSPKAIHKIEFTATQPKTFWNDLAAREYSFLSNVEPKVPHPRWSQEFETDIGTNERRKSLLHNGYAEQVADLYD